MYPVSNEGLNKETNEAVYFFTNAFYPLDNFSAHSVELWDIRFPTSEHAFQWKKFSKVSPDIAGRILSAKSPDAVKKISDTNKSHQPINWSDIRVSIMEEILHAKAKQHEDVLEVLKKTGKRTIIENSPVDSFWGIGPNGKGENIVGKLWMKIRDEII